MKLTDISNNIYGELTVLYKCGNTKDNKAIWLCICTCGKEVEMRGARLRKNKDPHLNCGLTHPYKICTVCGLNKPKNEYHRSKSNTNGLQPKCKSCIADRYISEREILREKYKDNCKRPEFKKRLAINNKKSRTKNKEKAAKYKAEYTRREDVKERRKEIHRIRKEKDMNYVIKRRLRWRIRDIVKKIGREHKYKSSLILLGCDMDFFKSYIESKFTDGMCWERISELHIDHIRPCDSFDLTKIEEQEECFHYSNLQPLWWRDNLIKGDLYQF